MCFHGFPSSPYTFDFFHWEAKVLEINAKLKAKSIDDPDSDKGHATDSDQDRVSPDLLF